MMTDQPTPKIEANDLEQRIVAKLEEIEELGIGEHQEALHRIVYETAQNNRDLFYSSEFAENDYAGLDANSIENILIGHTGLNGEVGNGLFMLLMNDLDFAKEGSPINTEELKETLNAANKSSEIAKGDLNFPFGDNLKNETSVKAPLRVMDDLCCWTSFHENALGDKAGEMRVHIEAFRDKWHSFEQIVEQLKEMLPERERVESVEKQVD